MAVERGSEGCASDASVLHQRAETREGGRVEIAESIHDDCQMQGTQPSPGFYITCDCMNPLSILPVTA